MEKVRRFIQAICSNALYRALAYILLCVVIALTATVTQSIKDKAKYTAMMEAQKAEIVAEYEAQIAEIVSDFQDQIGTMEYEYTHGTSKSEIEKEAEFIAKVLYGTAASHNSICQRTAVWCILNRVDHNSFPDSVQEVCQQPSQWIGYSDDNPILDSLYEIAMAELTIWHNGRRPVNEDYVYMSWTSNDIQLRNTYKQTNNTRYWQAN